MKKKLRNLIEAALVIATTIVADAALAQSYPSKPIRLVSPFPPGGSVDVVGRLLAAKLSESMGQQMVVDNRSGASGVIGTEVVMNSAPDGYTLLINTIPFVSNQFLMPRAPYDPLRDFVAVSLVASSPSFVTVHPSLPVRSIQELIALAKAKRVSSTTRPPALAPIRTLPASSSTCLRTSTSWRCSSRVAGPPTRRATPERGRSP